MLFMSIVGIFYGVCFEYLLWTYDWVDPVTVTGTKVGLEDMVLGFSTGGIVTSIVDVFFNKKRVQRAKSAVNTALFLFFFQIVLMLILFYSFRFNSSVATNLSLFISGSITLFYRRDLLRYALLTGMTMVILSIPFYLLLFFVTPDFLTNYFQLERLSGIAILTIPIEDLFFYFFAGYYFGPWYKFWKNIAIKNPHHYFAP